MYLYCKYRLRSVWHVLTVAPATSQEAVVCQTQQYCTCTYFCTIYQQYTRIVLDRRIQQYVRMVITYNKSMDQPGKVANPARGQLNRENEYFPVRVCA